MPTPLQNKELSQGSTLNLIQAQRYFDDSSRLTSMDFF